VTSTIGFIGLGLMGQAFTKRLTARGYTVIGYDLDEGKIERAAAHGVVAGKSAADVAARSELVLLCITSTDAVFTAVFSPGGIVEADGAGKILVDHSTTVVHDTREMAARLRKANGMAWVDAPVSGGPPAAETGTLAIMAGGAEEAIASIAPVMADLAATFTHMGAVGAGQATKMVNQILVLNNYCILAEALALAEAAGVDASRIPQALAPGHAGSNLLQAVFPRMIARDFAPAGYARQVMKDLDMVADLARSLKVPTPMTGQTTALYRMLINKGQGERDGIAVLKLYEPANDL
jgi:3-hydroxyisobutyrate dehydrogenase-like beta-hydroxyacid dehydrogenase